MKKINFAPVVISFLILPLFIAGCNKQDQGEVQVIDIVGNMNNTRDIKLSDIADDVQYIPMETNPECLIAKGYTIVPTKDYFFIADGEKPLFVFDRDGKFVRKIGAIGKGPGEFQNCNQFHIDEEKEEVYIFNQNKEFIIYSWDGKYISTVELPHRAMLYHISSHGDFTFFEFLMGPNSSLYRVYFTDRDLKLTGDISWEQEIVATYSLSVGTQVWNCDDEILARIEFCDTIYAIDRSLISPKVYLDFGSIRFRTEMLAVNDPKSFVKAVDNHVLNYSLATINVSWGIRFSLEQKTHLGLLNPDNQELVFASRIDTSMNGFINDIDGGPGYFPAKKFQEDEWIAAISAFDFHSMQQNGQFKNADVIDPDANKILNEMAAKLDVNDNPVLMLLKKKKNQTIL